MRRIKREPVKADFQIAPMIDCVFLLLIYFIMTSTLKKQEADVSFQLPGTVEQNEALEMPDEQFIEIREDGSVVVNEYAYGNINERSLVRLEGMLSRYKEASDANKSIAQVTILPSDEIPHSGVVKVMDACAKAEIKSVNFALGEEV